MTETKSYISPKDIESFDWKMWIPPSEYMKESASLDAWAKLFQSEFSPSKAMKIGDTFTASGMIVSSNFESRLNAGYDVRIREAEVVAKVPLNLTGPRITDQELFDRAAEILLTTGRRGVGSDGYIHYREHGKPLCIVGYFMEDTYHQGLENSLVATVRSYDDDLVLYRTVVSESLDFAPTNRQVRILKQLQILHDRLPVSRWVTGLAELAAGYGLYNETVLRFGRNFRVAERKRGGFFSYQMPKPKTLGETILGSKADLILVDECGLADTSIHKQMLENYMQMLNLYQEVTIKPDSHLGQLVEKMTQDLIPDPLFIDESSMFKEIEKPKGPVSIAVDLAGTADYTAIAAYIAPDSTTEEAAKPKLEGIWFGEKLLETA